MKTKDDLSQLNLDPAKVEEATRLINQAFELLGLKPIADDDKRQMLTLSPELLPAYEQIAALAERRADIIPVGLCDPADMRIDLSAHHLLYPLLALVERHRDVLADNLTATRSDIARQGNAGYTCAARVADQDMDVKAAIEPLEVFFKGRRKKKA